VIDVPGGGKLEVVARERRYRDPVGTLRLDVVDRAGAALGADLGLFGRGARLRPDDACGTRMKRSTAPSASSSIRISIRPAQPPHGTGRPSARRGMAWTGVSGVSCRRERADG